MADEHILTDAQLAAAAAALISSSSIGRYARLAARAAADAALSIRIRDEPRFGQRLLRWAEDAWPRVVGVKERDLAEIELAVVLSALGPTGLRGVDRLLERLAQVDQPSTAWVSALARQLRARGRKAR